MTSKRIFKSTIVYTALGFLAPAVNFFLIPIYSNVLKPSDFGIITLAAMVTPVLVNISGMGISGAFSRFYYDVLGDKKKIGDLLSTSILSIMLFTGVVGLLLILFGQHVLNIVFKNTEFTIAAYGAFMLFTALFTNLQTLIQSWYRNEEKVRLYSFWSVLFFVCAVIGIYWGIVVLRKGAIGSVGGRMWGMLIPTILFLIYFLSRSNLTFSSSLVRRMLVYGVPLVFYLLLTLAFNSIDKIMLERYFSLEELGIYGFAYLISTVIEILINAVNNAVHPQAFRMLKMGNSDSYERIRKLFSLSIWGLLFIIVWMMALSGPAITWFIDNRYHEAIFYIPLLAAAYIPRLLFTYYGIPFFYYNKTKILPWISGGSLIAGILFNFLLLPLLGIYGVCLAVFLTRMIQCFLAWVVGRKLSIVPAVAFNLGRELLLSIVLLILTVLSLILQHRLQSSWQEWAYFPIAIVYTIFIALYFARKGFLQKALFIKQ